MSIVDDVTTMSVAAEGNAFLLKQQAAKKAMGAEKGTQASGMGTSPSKQQLAPASSFAHGISMTQFEDLVKSVRDVEKSVRLVSPLTSYSLVYKQF